MAVSVRVWPWYPPPSLSLRAVVAGVPIAFQGPLCLTCRCSYALFIMLTTIIAAVAVAYAPPYRIPQTKEGDAVRAQAQARRSKGKHTSCLLGVVVLGYVLKRKPTYHYSACICWCCVPIHRILYQDAIAGLLLLARAWERSLYIIGVVLGNVQILPSSNHGDPH